MIAPSLNLDEWGGAHEGSFNVLPQAYIWHNMLFSHTLNGSFQWGTWARLSGQLRYTQGVFDSLGTSSPWSTGFGASQGSKMNGMEWVYLARVVWVHVRWHVLSNSYLMGSFHKFPKPMQAAVALLAVNLNLFPLELYLKKGGRGRVKDFDYPFLYWSWRDILAIFFWYMLSWSTSYGVTGVFNFLW